MRGIGRWTTFPPRVRVVAMDGSGNHISLVLHSTDTVKKGEMLPVEGAPPPRTVEIIAGTQRKTVVVD